MGITGEGSFPVLSGGSLIILYYRCRSLALNRDVFPALEAGTGELSA